MKSILLATTFGLIIATSSLYATQTLSITGPLIWGPGPITLSITDTYSGFGGGSYGLSYWFEVNSAIAPFLTITGLTYFTFTDGNNIGTFPFSFNSTSGADPGFMTTTTANGLSGDLGATSEPLILVPDGTYHVTNVTFALSGFVPIGIYTLRTTTASPRVSLQVTSDFNDAPFPQASFTFCTYLCPEPSTLTLLGLAGFGAGVMAYLRRK